MSGVENTVEKSVEADAPQDAVQEPHEDDRVKPIAQVLVDVSRAVGAVKKEGYNANNKYNFRGIDGVMNAVWPALYTYGVFMQPEVLEIHYSTAQTNNGKVVNVVRIRYQLTFHGPAGDKLSVIVWGEANDYGDKATAKAHSVALRTALLQALCLPTEERDPDEDTYDHSQPQQQAAPPPTPEQVAAYQDIANRMNQVADVEQLRALVDEAATVPCLEPLGQKLVVVIGMMAAGTTHVDDVKALWKIAEAGGVLDSVRAALMTRASEIKQSVNDSAE